MAQQQIGIGAAPNDGNGETARAAFTKVNANSTDSENRLAALETDVLPIPANTAKVSADGSVTTHSDVSDAGSGAIITTPERTKIGHITVTQAVDLDQIETDTLAIAANTAKVSADGSVTTHSDVDQALATTNNVLFNDLELSGLFIPSFEQLSATGTGVEATPALKIAGAAPITTNNVEIYVAPAGSGIVLPQATEALIGTKIKIATYITANTLKIYPYEIDDIIDFDYGATATAGDPIEIQATTLASSGGIYPDIVELICEGPNYWVVFIDQATQTGSDVKFETLALTGNLTVDGTVDGIDIATDVAANTAKVTNVPTSLSLGNHTPVSLAIDSDGGASQIILAQATGALSGLMSVLNYNKTNWLTITHAIDLDQIETDTNTNNAKVSADGSVTTHSDITDAGSGAIITVAERALVAGRTTVVKSADQAKISDPTIGADSELAIALGAGETWLFTADIVADEGANNPNIKFRMGASGGLTGTIEYSIISEVEQEHLSDFTTVSGLFTLSTNKRTIRISGAVKTVLAGTLSVEWAQNITDTDPTTVYACSTLSAFKAT